MEKTLNTELDVRDGEFPDCDTFNTPNWVFSDIKNVIKEPLQLTTNDTVQIIYNGD